MNSCVNIIEFQESDNNFTYYKIALFDSHDFTEEEALKIIKNHEFSLKMVIMSKPQYENVFRSLINK